jgi:hypothetical protein
MTAERLAQIRYRAESESRPGIARTWYAEDVPDLLAEVERLQSLLREWRRYTDLRTRIRLSDDPSEYETGRDLLARTDAAVGDG